MLSPYKLPLGYFLHTATLIVEYDKEKAKMAAKAVTASCLSLDDSGIDSFVFGGDTTSSPNVSNAEDGDIEFEVFKMIKTLRQLPYRDYVCHRCGKRGHRIQFCPTRAVDAPTSYQGDKRSFGKYHCAPCNTKWSSENSFSNKPQRCRRCEKGVFPYKMFPLPKQ